jgi:hypothetical protein
LLAVYLHYASEQQFSAQVAGGQRGQHQDSSRSPVFAQRGSVEHLLEKLPADHCAISLSVAASAGTERLRHFYPTSNVKPQL